MGARSSPEGYRVAAGRYGLPVQMRAQMSLRLRIAGVITIAVTAAGCSHVTGSKSSKDDKPLTCTFIVKLDQIASTVAATDVHNPETFKHTLDGAVKEYVANVRSLRAIAPVDLHASLERVEADVQQYRFEAALTDRAALDAYAARTCDRVTSTATTVANGATTSTSAPGSAATVRTEPTTTSVPSGG
jgi:hypothetical protein